MDVRKRVLCFSLVLLFTVLSQVPSGTPALASTIYDAPYVLLDGTGQAVLPSVSELCWTGDDGLFFLGGSSGDVLFYWQLDQQTIEVLDENPFETLGTRRSKNSDSWVKGDSFVFTLSDGLYAFTLKTGQIKQYVVPATEWETIGEIDIISPIFEDVSFTEIKDIIRDDDTGTLYFLVPYEEGDESVLICYDLTNGEWTAQKGTNIEGIATYKAGELLVYVDGQIKPYQPQTESYGEAIVAADAPPAPFVYDNEMDRLIFLRDGDIYQRQGNGDEELVRLMEIRYRRTIWEYYLSHEHEYQKTPVTFLLLLPGNRLAYQTKNLLIDGTSDGSQSEFLFTVHCTPIVGETQELHITPSVSNISNAFYELTHPNVRIEKCITGDDHAQDVLLTSTGNYLSNLIREGNVQDLSLSQYICDITALYMPQIQEALVVDGKIFGVPTNLGFSVLAYNQEKWTALGLPDVPETVDELFDLITLWDTQYAKKYPNQMLLGSGAFNDNRVAVWAVVTEAYINEYTLNTVPPNFDTPEYRELLTRIMEIPDLPDGEWDVLFRIFDYSYQLYFTLYDLRGGNTFNEYTCILPLKLHVDKTLSIPASASVLYLPSDAPSPDLALEYLAFIAEFQSTYQPEVMFMLTGSVESLPVIPSCNSVFQPYPGLGLSQVGLTILEPINGNNPIRNEMLDFYRYAVPYLDFSIYFSTPTFSVFDYDLHLPWWNYWQEASPTIDEFISELNDMASKAITGTQ